jgi:hypothetical protein
MSGCYVRSWTMSTERTLRGEHTTIECPPTEPYPKQIIFGNDQVFEKGSVILDHLHAATWYWYEIPAKPLPTPVPNALACAVHDLISRQHTVEYDVERAIARRWHELYE